MLVRQPMSERSAGLAPSGALSGGRSSRAACWDMSGLVELGHRVGLRRPAVDHGRGRGHLLHVRAPCPPSAHGQQRLASGRAVYPPPCLTVPLGTEGSREAARRPTPESNSSAACLLVSTSCFTIRPVRIRKPPISRRPRNGRQFTSPAEPRCARRRRARQAWSPAFGRMGRAEARQAHVLGAGGGARAGRSDCCAAKRRAHRISSIYMHLIASVYLQG